MLTRRYLSLMRTIVSLLRQLSLDNIVVTACPLKFSNFQW